MIDLLKHKQIRFSGKILEISENFNCVVVATNIKKKEER